MRVTAIQHIRTLLWVLAIVFFTWLMARIVFQYAGGRLDVDFLLSKQHIVHLLHYRLAFYLHIFPALLVLAAGITQFSNGILTRRPAVHRWVGKIYAGSILMVCGPAGFIMAWYSNGGWIARSSFLVLSVLWWVSTWLAWRAIKQGDRVRHRAWMIRSYALTLSAVTLRVMQFYFAIRTDLDADTVYQMIAWPSWLINLLVAELILSRQQNVQHLAGQR